MTTATPDSITPGIYTHYKGHQYQVYEVATHSETEEKLVVYRCLYGNHDLWVRPVSMFTETVKLSNGTTVARFSLSEAHDNPLNKPR